MGGSGFDHLAPWDAARITVTNGAGVLAPFLAESVTGAMLAHGCGFPNYAEQQRERRWRPVSFTPLRGRTLLVAGFGRIGECVARNAKALGMRVLATRATPAPHPAADEMHGPDALASLLAASGLRVAPRAAGCGDARPPLPRDDRGHEAGGVPRQHLARCGRRRGGPHRPRFAPATSAGPISTCSRPSRCPPRARSGRCGTCIITPHASDNIVGWPRRFAELFADNLARWRSGEPLLNVVSP